jgi:hypothetical protein
MVYNLPTTRALLDRLATDTALRRICGWERKNDVSDEELAKPIEAIGISSQSGQERKIIRP